MLQTEPDLTPAATVVLKQALAGMRPHVFHGFGKARYGRANDGGYVMLDTFDGVRIAYSLGINNDVSWDRDMADKGIKIFQYDHTIEGLPEDHPNFQWHKVGIGPTPAPELSIDTLPRLIERNGHAGRRDMILKCDIEGMEWAVLQAIPQDVLDQFSQILLETHGWEHFANPQHADGFAAAIEKLTTNHRLIHVHANNHAPLAVVGGIPIPDVLEISLVRSDTGPSSPSDEMFPGPLDRPCDPGAADFFLGRFVFQ